MALYNYTNWVNQGSPGYYLGTTSNAAKLTSAQFSLSDDVYTNAAQKVTFFEEVPDDQLVASRHFRFGSSFHLHITTTIPAGHFTSYNSSGYWYRFSWTADTPDEFTTGNTWDEFDNNGGKLANMIAPPWAPLGASQSIIDHFAGSHLDTANVFEAPAPPGRFDGRHWPLGFVARTDL